MLRLLAKYSLVGVANTLVTLAVIHTLVSVGIGPLTANVAGFAVGLANSYVMNRSFTFRRPARDRRMMRFLLAFGICYFANLAIVLAAGGLERMHPMIPHLLGMLAYNLAFFMLMRVWVFRSNET